MGLKEQAEKGHRNDGRPGRMNSTKFMGALKRRGMWCLVLCHVLNAINTVRQRAPQSVGVSSSLRGRKWKGPDLAQKCFSLDPFRQKLWSKPSMRNSCRCLPSSTGFLRSNAVPCTGATSPGGKRTKVTNAAIRPYVQHREDPRFYPLRLHFNL